MDKVFIRVLDEADAKTSWKWRNNKIVWQLTGSKPDRVISYEIELEWLQNVLKRDDEIRFAICESETGKYIGNVQLTNINSYDATLHIYIGDTNCWGKGYGTEATRLMVKYGLDVLKLQSIWLDVNKKNIAAIRTYEKTGFLHLFDYDEYHRMSIHKLDSIGRKVSVFIMTYNHEKFISEALDGILNQHANFDFEIVLGDDFSKDNTRAIILKYAINYPLKFKLLFYPKNLTAAINQLWVMKNCRCKYVALCEGDDYWTDTLKLQKQVDFLEANPDFNICWTKATFFDTINNKQYVPESFELALNGKNQYEIDLNAYYEKYATPTLTAVFIAGDLFRFNLKRFSYLNDSVLFFILLSQGKGALLNFNSAVYRIHISGAWSGIDDYKKKLMIFYALDSAIKRIPKLALFDHLTTWRKWNLTQAYYLLTENFSIKDIKQLTFLLIKIFKYQDQHEKRKALNTYFKTFFSIK